jgi:predicted nucleotidyltransferase
MSTTAAEVAADPLLAEIIRRIVAAIDPDRIIPFGSRARGDAKPDSDYDLLVVKDTSERTLVLEQRAYRAMLGVRAGPVDILVATPEHHVPTSMRGAADRTPYAVRGRYPGAPAETGVRGRREDREGCCRVGARAARRRCDRPARRLRSCNGLT